jgi:hypothetical protein
MRIDREKEEGEGEVKKNRENNKILPVKELDGVSAEVQSGTENKNIRTMKITFDPKNKKDWEQLMKLEGLVVKVNENGGPPKVKPNDVLKWSIDLISEDFITKHQRNAMSDAEKLSYWTKKFNDKNKTHYSPTEFAVQVLPKLKQAELQAIQE